MGEEEAESPELATFSKMSINKHKKIAFLENIHNIARIFHFEANLSNDSDTT